MEAILEAVRSSPPWLGLGIVLVAAAAEYLIPPLPADSVLLAGSLLIVAGAQPFTVVWGAAVVGGVIGMWIHLVIGSALRARDGQIRGSRYVERWLGEGSLSRFQELLRRYGDIALLVNRALPAIRGVAFVAAGAAGVPRVRALALGAMSQGLWSLGILALGVSIGDHWEDIQRAFIVYRNVVYTVGSVGVLAAIVVIVWKKRKSPPSS